MAITSKWLLCVLLVKYSYNTYTNTATKTGAVTESKYFTGEVNHTHGVGGDGRVLRMWSGRWCAVVCRNVEWVDSIELCVCVCEGGGGSEHGN